MKFQFIEFNARRAERGADTRLRTPSPRRDRMTLTHPNCCAKHQKHWERYADTFGADQRVIDDPTNPFRSDGSARDTR